MLASRYEIEPRGLINLRGIGKVKTFFLTGRKGGTGWETAEREQRVEPSATFVPP